MTTINLYQNQEEQQKLSQRTANGGFIFSLSILIITLLVLMGLKFYSSVLTKQSAALTENIKQQNNSLAGVNSLQKVLDMQTRLAKIKDNLKVKDGNASTLKMTEVLDHLGSDLSSGVVVNSYTFESGKVKVTFAVNNFSDAARQILNFKKSTYFTNANLVNITRGEKNILCDVSMDVK